MGRLSTGAEMRVTGTPRIGTVVCLGGGRAREVEGTWGGSIEWLVRELSPGFPELAFAEVRYRIRSWRRVDWCVEDARAAIVESASERTLLLGFSMGCAVAIAAAGERSVRGVLGLAPWIPEELDVAPVADKSLVVLHGSLDRPLPGVPGVSPAISRRGFERATAAGASGSYTIIPGALHGVALRRRGGGLLPLPRARRWASLVESELRRFAGS